MSAIVTTNPEGMVDTIEPSTGTKECQGLGGPQVLTTVILSLTTPQGREDESS